MVYAVKYPGRIRKRLATPRASETRTFGWIAACVMAVGGASVCLVTSSSQMDLSDLTPVTRPPGDTPILSWRALLRDHKLTLDAGDAPHDGMHIRALGYAMDADRPMHDGERAGAFVLLPDAGTLIHPAHRFGDQMISVRLRAGDTFQFHAGELVWVHGTLRYLPGDSTGSIALYRLEQARVEPAHHGDIGRYFR